MNLQNIVFKGGSLMWLFIKNLVFTVLVPGTVAIYFPYRIVKGQYDSFSISWGVLQILSVFVIFAGTIVYFWCLWDFAMTGRGTPAPIDAPKHLVVKGLYCYVRNPMYIGVIFIILGWAALYDSYSVLQYAALMWLIFYAVVIIIEEPILRRQFGETYKNYCKQVNRWIPGKRYENAQ